MEALPAAVAMTKARRIVLLVLGLACLLLALVADVVKSLRASPAPPAAPTMALGEHTATFSPLGVEVNLPLPWTRLEVPPQPFPNVALRHPGGAAFLVLVTTAERNTTIDQMLQSTLANKRRQYPDLRDVTWGREQVAALSMRTLAFTQTGPNGPARTKLWAGARGDYWVTFTCAAAPDDFEHSEALCRQVLGGVTMRAAFANDVTR